MINENIKNLRKQKGLTQEAFAIKLNVVRQTVSKWEKGISVPDAQMLQRMAEELEVSVQDLLGEASFESTNSYNIGEQLSRINEQLAMRNRRSSIIWKIVSLILAINITFLCGKMISDNQAGTKTVEKLPDKIEISGVSFSGDESELICSFVPSYNNPSMRYVVTMHSHDSSFPDESVDANCENGMVIACFDRRKLLPYTEYNIVVSIDSGTESRNINIADSFHFDQSGYSWTPVD